MKRNWFLIKEILSEARQELKINEHTRFFTLFRTKDEEFNYQIKYQIKLLIEIKAINFYYYQNGVIIVKTELGQQMLNVLTTMEEKGVDLNTLDTPHPTILREINPLINEVNGLDLMTLP